MWCCQLSVFFCFYILFIKWRSLSCLVYEMRYINKAASLCLLYLQPDVCVSWPIDPVEDLSSVLSWCLSDHRGADPGEGLCAALPSGSLPQPVARRLPQHEEDREPTAPLCGAGRCQSQDPPPATGTVSAAASPGAVRVEWRRVWYYDHSCLPLNFPVFGSGLGHSLKEKLPLPQISAAHWFFCNPDYRLFCHQNFVLKASGFFVLFLFDMNLDTNTSR